MRRLLFICYFSLFQFLLSGLYSDLVPQKKSDLFYNPTSSFNDQSTLHLYLSGEYLNWRAQEGGLYYVQGGRSIPVQDAYVPGGVGPAFDGDLKRIEMKWDPGLRVSLGMHFKNRNWDLEGTWTYFKTDSISNYDGYSLSLSGVSTIQTSENISNYGIFDMDSVNDPQAKWNLNMNLADLSLKAPFWFGKKFSVTPFLGGRGSWITQDFDIDVNYDTSWQRQPPTHPTNTPIAKGKTTNKTNFRGGGIRSGAEANFHLGSGFSLFTFASGSLIFGRAHSFYKHVEFDENNSELLIAQTQDQFYMGIPVIQYILGFKWDLLFADQRCHLGLQVGWEQNIWFSLNQIDRFFHKLPEMHFKQENSNLALQGLSVSARFDF
jgi:hypothetical protein